MPQNKQPVLIYFDSLENIRFEVFLDDEELKAIVDGEDYSSFDFEDRYLNREYYMQFVTGELSSFGIKAHWLDEKNAQWKLLDELWSIHAPDARSALIKYKTKLDRI